MVDGNEMIDRLEWAQPRLAAVTAVCAAAMFVGGLFFKSTRSAGSMMWLDGVKPWVGWAVLGGLTILAQMSIGWWSDRWLVPAIAAALLFAQAGREAAAYRDRLEVSFAHQALYTEQSLALGLRIVPALAVIGAVAAGLLAATTLWRIVSERRHDVWPVAPSSR
jgi:hypothetical protein